MGGRSHCISAERSIPSTNRWKWPFARWIHRHEFDEVGTQSRLTDRVDFELPGGPLVTGCFGWVVKIGLARMFDYRHRITRQYCQPSTR